MRRSLLTLLSCLVMSLWAASPASAWIHYHGGGIWRGPAGGWHAWHGGYTAGGRWGWGRPWGWGWGGPAPGAAAAFGAAAGIAAGAALGAAAATPPPLVVDPAPLLAEPPVGTSYASLPGGCVPATVAGVQYYRCGATYYRAYYGHGRVVYQVVPPPF